MSVNQTIFLCDFLPHNIGFCIYNIDICHKYKRKFKKMLALF